MRITIAHHRTREEVVRIVDHSLDEVLQAVPIGPIQIADEKRTWSGPHLAFSLLARMGFFRAPVSGTVDVTDSDVTIEVGLPPVLHSLIPEDKVKAAVEGKFRALLA